MSFYNKITIIPITLFISTCIYQLIDTYDYSIYNDRIGTDELDKSLLSWEAMLLY